MPSRFPSFVTVGEAPGMFAPTHEALLRAILDDPDCDLHRMAMADWLEEQGEDARAEFIRVQLELASLPFQDVKVNPSCDFAYYLLLRRCCDLIPRDPIVARTASSTTYGLETVSDGWHLWGKSALPHFAYRRGFIESIVCDWAWWEQHHAEVLACQPVRKVYLTSIVEGYQPASRHPDGSPDWSGYYQGVRWALAGYWPKLEFVLPEQGG